LESVSTEPHAGATQATKLGLSHWRDGHLCWYALYVRSCWEKRVSAVLTSQLPEVYLPMHRVWSRRTMERKEVEEPVFPGYLFVRCNLTKETWLTIKKTMGVVRILGIGDDPVPVPDHEIESLRQVLSVQPYITGHPRLRKGDRVRVVKGPMKGVLGTLVEVSRNRHKLVVSVELINRAVSTSIDVSMVERLDDV
jgi:transcriptional antiterminator NusG